MQSVTMKKSDLMNRVEKNRKEHRSLFLKAQDGYRQAVIGELNVMLAEAKERKPMRRMINLPEPEDHTADYDRVIDMIEMSIDDEVELSAQEFDWYVRDNWAWSALATMTNSSYVTTR